MELSKAIGMALKEARDTNKLTQEDFVGVSGRTYLSEIERGLKKPTLEKLDQIATRMGMHPLELLVACYSKRDAMSATDILQLIQARMLGQDVKFVRLEVDGHAPVPLQGVDGHAGPAISPLDGHAAPDGFLDGHAPSPDSLLDGHGVAPGKALDGHAGAKVIVLDGHGGGA
ncbi:helix-turn-helix domain-containing protein [Pseudomonas ovata]|uniref:helix-turn-helix domain-containing protein n=1 Tax=Pseudomonas ovata TaxID=1839709 RepID=UPI001F4EC59C|nr:helix-turn-helix transcriptional regulator [Pseudomonas ovata]